MRKFVLLFLASFMIIPFAATYAAAPHKTWTFLIFLNGNNNLDHFGAFNIKAMEKIGSDDQVNVVVQWASLSARKTVRLLVQKSTNPSKVTSPIVEDMGLVDMGDYRSLQDFVAWGVKNYPADHYFVDVWNHGSGWNYKNLDITKNISYDEISGHHITTQQLGWAMAHSAKLIGHKVDLYASDACLMAMIEVANELSDSVDIFAGSEEVEPGAGWAYDDLLAQWRATSNPTPADVAKILTDTYVKSYQGGSNGNREVTFSAFDLNQINALNVAITDLANEVKQLSPKERATVLKTAQGSQSFSNWDFHDLLDFVKGLRVAKVRGIKPETLNALEDAASHFIIANKTSKNYVDAKGVSIWIPSYLSTYKNSADVYNQLAFNRNTNWTQALESLLQGTN